MKSEYEKRRQQNKQDLVKAKFVITPDGEGEIVDTTMRKNTNGGPGTRQFVVRLLDGRIHRYASSKIISRD